MPLWGSSKAPDAQPVAAAAHPDLPSPSHPIALFFHVALKAIAIVWYWIGTLVTDSYVINFVICLVTLAMDFWVTKNVTGRLLVGLRWWNEANDTGSAWRFETLPEGTRNILPREKRLFWMGLMIMTGHWILALVIAFFGFSSYIVVAVIGVLFSASNLFGYFKCSREAQAEMKGFISSGSNKLMQGALKSQLQSAVARV